MENSSCHFFASANSGKGFVNHFASVFSGLNRHYIIKGGPGTGKSSIMNKVGKKAEALGMNVEYFHCSSDPKSLDGVLIPDLRIGITDGTAPHTADPLCPGAYDEIIDPGRFWDSNKLSERKDDILSINKEKSDLYSRAYSFLSGALDMEKANDRFISDIVDNEKLSAFCCRLIKGIKPKVTENRIEKIRLIRGITPDSTVTLSGYGAAAERIYTVKDSYGIGGLLLHEIKSSLGKTEVYYSHTPLNPDKIDMLYLPHDKILFTTDDNGKGACLNADRFINKPKYKEVKSILKSNQRIISDIMNQAYDMLVKAKVMHLRLEEIYTGSMDFEALESYTEKIITGIFS